MNTCGQRQYIVGLERVHGRNADERGTLAVDVVLERPAEAQVGERDIVPVSFERGRDVLHAERFDAEEGAESVPFVPRDRAQQQDLHDGRSG